ncbi:hypothetical protein HanPI659440_Chr04g0160841 [Helianthus annuus]|nr:hypothetical protein HanPI659440_Chr04g0160841 [Helianthus annuus]
MVVYRLLLLIIVAFLCFVACIGASDGDADPIYMFCLGIGAGLILWSVYRSVSMFRFSMLETLAFTLQSISILSLLRDCVEQCEKTGCVGAKCFQHCNMTSDGKSVGDPWYLQEPLYIKWKKWDCLSGCRYQCMLAREEEREKAGGAPVKYHGKWPLKRAFGIEEPVAVALAALNLAVQFHGWVSFYILVNYKLPLRPTRQTYYEYTGLCHVYGTLSMNFLFWSAVYHSRYVATLAPSSPPKKVNSVYTFSLATA